MLGTVWRAGEENTSVVFMEILAEVIDDFPTSSTALMYKFHNELLPIAFHSFFTRVTNTHNYNTRLAAKQSYYLPFVRTNYGKFNIRFQGPSIWNSIDDHIKLSSVSMFKKKMQVEYLERY